MNGENEGVAAWERMLNESRNNCRTKIAEAEANVSELHRAIWPRRPRGQMPHDQRKAMQSHISVIDYCDIVRVHREHNNRVRDLWEEQLATVNLPGNFDDVPVSLSTLDDKWEHMLIKTKKADRDELHGKSESYDVKMLLLPVSPARKCYRQLNQITEQLGYAGSPQHKTEVFGWLDEDEAETETTES